MYYHRVNSLKHEVDNPDHYTVGGYEALDVIKAKLTPEEFRGMLKGNILKYMMRANYKGSHDKDISKARFYVTMLEEELNGEATKDPTYPKKRVRRPSSCASGWPWD